MANYPTPYYGIEDFTDKETARKAEEQHKRKMEEIRRIATAPLPSPTASIHHSKPGDDTAKGTRFPTSSPLHGVYDEEMNLQPLALMSNMGKLLRHRTLSENQVNDLRQLYNVLHEFMRNENIREKEELNNWMKRLGKATQSNAELQRLVDASKAETKRALDSQREANEANKKILEEIRDAVLSTHGSQGSRIPTEDLAEEQQETVHCFLCDRDGHAPLECRTIPAAGDRMMKANQLSICIRCLGEASHESCPEESLRCPHCLAIKPNSSTLGHSEVFCSHRPLPPSRKRSMEKNHARPKKGNKGKRGRPSPYDTVSYFNRR